MKPSLSVLLVSQFMPPWLAGAELKALAIARTLIDRGVNVEIATTRFDRTLKSREVVDGVPLTRLSVFPQAPGRRGPASRRAAFKSSAFLRTAIHVATARGIDVVHAFCVSASSLGAIAGARVRRIPIMIEPSVGGPEGELARLDGYAFGPASKKLLLLADRFASLNEQLSQELVDVGADPAKLISMRNCVDFQRFRPASVQEARDIRREAGLTPGPLAMFVGQLLERKGVRELLAAWGNTARALPDATLVFVGDGPLAGPVERAARDPGLRVASLGTRTDVERLIRCADVLVLPSRNESFGNVIIEAMASAVAVVCGPTGVAARRGFDRVAKVVDPSRNDDISCALTEILRSAELRSRLGQAGREFARQFDVQLVATDYERAYQGLRKTRGR